MKGSKVAFSGFGRLEVSIIKRIRVKFIQNKSHPKIGSSFIYLKIWRAGYLRSNYSFEKRPKVLSPYAEVLTTKMNIEYHFGLSDGSKTSIELDDLIFKL